MRPSPTAGQASLEYVAAISLVAAVLVFAAPAVGAPSLAGTVARGLRLGICIVARDYCHAVDAAVDHLNPCTLGGRVTGADSEVSVLNVRFGADDQWSATAGSDGSVSITHQSGATRGVVAGIGIEAPWKIDVGAEASAGLRFQTAAGWRFGDADAAKRFIAGLPRSTLTTAPSWRSVAGGGAASASVAVRGGGLDLATLGAAARLAEGIRVGPGGTYTLYGELIFSTPELKALGSQIAGFGNGRMAIEYTFAGGRPIQLAFRGFVPDALGNRATETLRRLDLRNPGNEFAARALLGAGMFRPPTPEYVRDVGRVLRWIDSEGTIERADYDVSDTSKSVGLTLKLGEELGMAGGSIRIAQTLVGASAKVPGGRFRERFDCVDQLRR